MDLRDPIKDYELYRETCQELQRLMAEIQELKSRGIKDNVRRRSLRALFRVFCSLVFSINLRAGALVDMEQHHPPGTCTPTELSLAFAQAEVTVTELLICSAWRGLWGRNWARADSSGAG